MSRFKLVTVALTIATVAAIPLTYLGSQFTAEESAPVSTAPSTTSSTTSSTATSRPTPASFMTLRAEATSYLESLGRIQRYERQWKRTTGLAEALLAEKFGPVVKFSLTNAPYSADYVGWGGLKAVNNVASVSVYWRNGAPDYSEGIRAFTLDGLHIETFLEGEGHYYASHRTETGVTYITSVGYIGFERSEGNSSPYWYACTKAELMGLDDKIFEAMMANFTRHGF